MAEDVTANTEHIHGLVTIFFILFAVLLPFLIFLTLRKISKELERSNRLFNNIASDMDNMIRELNEIKYIKLCESGMTTVSLNKAIERDVELQNDY